MRNVVTSMLLEHIYYVRLHYVYYDSSFLRAIFRGETEMKDFGYTNTRP